MTGDPITALLLLLLFFYCDNLCPVAVLGVPHPLLWEDPLWDGAGEGELQPLQEVVLSNVEAGLGRREGGEGRERGREGGRNAGQGLECVTANLITTEEI